MTKPIKKSKYKSKKTGINLISYQSLDDAKQKGYDGKLYDSYKEAKRAVDLLFLLKVNAISNLKEQVKYTWLENHTLSESYIVGKQFKRSYIADFVYINNLGIEIIEDVKGFRTPEYLKKKKIVEKLFGIVITEI